MALAAILKISILYGPRNVPRISKPASQLEFLSRSRFDPWFVYPKTRKAKNRSVIGVFRRRLAVGSDKTDRTADSRVAGATRNVTMCYRVA
jgi:hypothetical protein